MAGTVRGKATRGKVSAQAWATARQRFEVLEQFLSRTVEGANGTRSRAAVRRPARRLASDLLSIAGPACRGRHGDALLPHPPGVKPGAHRLSAAVEGIIAEEIHGFHLTRERPQLVKLVERIHARCHAQGLPRPQARTIKARVQALPRDKVHRRRNGGRAARESFAPVVGTLATERPLQIVQIDHTKVDLFVVEEVTRQVLGRPWLTLAIDVHTRMVAGFYVSFDAPSATSVAICLALSVADKAPWLAALEIPGEWPVRGIPERVHVDNGREFQSRAFETACTRYAISIDYRPVRTPHYGGHIERLIGTVMGRVHMLPGTTFSSVEDRRDYDSKRHAALTLRELECWLALEIVGKYHAAIHSALLVPPREKWRQEAGGRGARMPKNARDFLIDFLPFERRRVRRDGVHLFGVAYWTDALAPFLVNGDSIDVHYDPRDLRRVFVRGVSGAFVDAPYRNNLGRPAISLWEQRAVLSRLWAGWPGGRGRGRDLRRDRPAAHVDRRSPSHDQGGPPEGSGSWRNACHPHPERRRWRNGAHGRRAASRGPAGLWRGRMG
jgi:putative transposase